MTNATGTPQTVATGPHTVAFMDFGTNSIRLLVVRIDPNQSFTILHKLKETVRLGEGEFSRNRLQPQAIARAIVHRPSILVADEPTGNLDAAYAADLGELFRSFNQVGVTVVIATHDEAFAARLKPRLIALRDGRLAA